VKGRRGLRSEKLKMTTTRSRASSQPTPQLLPAAAAPDTMRMGTVAIPRVRDTACHQNAKKYRLGGKGHVRRSKEPLKWGAGSGNGHKCNRQGA